MSPQKEVEGEGWQGGQKIDFKINEEGNRSHTILLGAADWLKSYKTKTHHTFSSLLIFEQHPEHL